MAFFETIHYTVIQKDGPIELREYDDILLASTQTPINIKQNSGFSRIFNYISGENKENTKISMTTPVVTYEENNRLVTGFYVPSKYNKETVPKPNKDMVFINELESSLYAVIKFKGKWTEKNYDQHDQILLNYLKDSQYKIVSQRFVFRYQPPMFPGFLRRNEIAYQIILKNA
ncbi:MAG TPA: heme-binding protein [Candidatus Izemoplasmatales bacterium]|nr:heme-binding protein [Candidatus Izemoplasmatales bacterium]